MSFCIKKYLVFSLRKSNNTKYYRTKIHPCQIIWQGFFYAHMCRLIVIFTCLIFLFNVFNIFSVSEKAYYYQLFVKLQFSILLEKGANESISTLMCNAYVLYNRKILCYLFVRLISAYNWRNKNERIESAAKKINPLTCSE
jgi:hypothetical protein